MSADIPALVAEVESAIKILQTPAARLITHDGERLVTLADVEALFVSKALTIDACRHAVRAGDAIVSLATRPVLFALVRALGEAWPADVPRGALLARAFGAKFTDESHRARLRVEIARLRRKLGALAEVNATEQGFVLVPGRGRKVVVLARPVEEEHADALAAAGKVQSVGQARARRWMTPPVPGFTTTLLLPAPLPGD